MRGDSHSARVALAHAVPWGQGGPWRIRPLWGIRMKLSIDHHRQRS